MVTETHGDLTKSTYHQGASSSVYNHQSADNQYCLENFATGWPLSTVNGTACVSTEAQATPSLTEGVEMPAGLARPGPSPAVSLTVDWQRQVPVSVEGCVPAPGHWVSVAELQPGGGMSGIPIGHTRSIANPGVLVATQHLDYANGCDNQGVHTHNNLCVAAAES